MNLRAVFLPGTTADPDDYWLGLGIIALIDAVRLTLTGPGGGLALWLVVLFFVFALHANRLRHAGRARALAFVAVGAGIAAKAVAGFIAMAVALTPWLFDYFEAQDVDVDDPQALQEASRDPELMQGFQAYIQEREAQVMGEVAAASAWPSLVAFWVVLGLLGLWYARMSRAGIANDRR